MNLNDMKISDLVALVNALKSEQSTTAPHPFVGRYVLCRCYSAGVHAGILVSQTGDQAVLKGARRLWNWKAKSGVALSGLAVHGLAGGKIDTLVDDIALTGVIETIPCTATAQESINAA